jgi:hypothetical protein
VKKEIDAVPVLAQNAADYSSDFTFDIRKSQSEILLPVRGMN